MCIIEPSCCLQAYNWVLNLCPVKGNVDSWPGLLELTFIDEISSSEHLCAPLGQHRGSGTLCVGGGYRHSPPAQYCWQVPQRNPAVTQLLSPEHLLGKVVFVKFRIS